jgi:hypothetical protein
VKTTQSLKAFTFFAVLAGLFVPVKPVLAAPDLILPKFHDFIAGVKNGQAGVVTGVYVPGLFAYPVMLQPEDNPGFVSPRDGVLTQFRPAAVNKVIGLLAHNTLAGAAFSSLTVGQEIRVVYGDGQYVSYWVNEVDRFQALSPTDVYSKFYDPVLDHTYSTQEIFNRFYTGGNHITLQTCIANDGEPSWGRLFVTATPKIQLSEVPLLDSLNLLIRAWRGLAEVRN